MSQRSPVARLALLALAVLSFGACASVPYVLEERPPDIVQPADGSPERVALNARTYDAVVRHVERMYYDPDFGGVPFRQEARSRRAAAVAQPTSEAFHAELRGLLRLLRDGHTYTWSHLRRVRNYEQLQGGPYISYGFSLIGNAEEWIVESVAPGTAAAGAGVLPGWRLETIAGRPAALAPLPTPGRTDALVFIDEAGQRHERDLAGVPTPLASRFQARRLEGGIAYMRLDGFGQTSYEGYIAELQSFAADPPAGVIIDLRGNRGGPTLAMGAMTTWLYADEQEIVIMNGRLYSMATQPNPYLGPVVMLIGRFSASSAELFSGVAQENGRAVIVGQTSAGSVTGTQPIELPDGGMLYVGTITVTTPGGKRLEGVGVTPDVIVPEDWQAVREGRDPTLDAGVAALEAMISARRQALSAGM